MSNAEVAVTRINIKKRPKYNIVSHKADIFMEMMKKALEENIKSQQENKVRCSNLEDEKVFDEIDNADNVIADYMGKPLKAEDQSLVDDRVAFEPTIRMRVQVLKTPRTTALEMTGLKTKLRVAELEDLIPVLVMLLEVAAIRPRSMTRTETDSAYSQS
eukprot:TRINITY_DN10371_c0_g2_i11.p4 TRINITY_DN10371_c0_g2~~TRINITY_DN10371_c0_g2_i11.p4  ORF type:complete len:159 (+),score=33.94 TRINITY_DN10371_c0_g2_i11:821-1297(+)